MTLTIEKLKIVADRVARELGADTVVIDARFADGNVITDNHQ